MSKYQGPVFHKKLQTERSQSKPTPREVKRTQQPTIEQNYVPFYKTHEPKRTFETPVKQKQTTAKNDSIYEDRTSTPFKVTHVPPSFFGKRKKKEEEQDQINYQVIFRNLSKTDDEFLLFEEYLSDYGEEQVARIEAQLGQETGLEEQNSAQMESAEEAEVQTEKADQETAAAIETAPISEPITESLPQETQTFETEETKLEEQNSAEMEPTEESEVQTEYSDQEVTEKSESVIESLPQESLASKIEEAEVVEEEAVKPKEPKKRGLSRSLAGMIQDEQDPFLNKGRNIARYFGESLQEQQPTTEPATISELLAQSRQNQSSNQLESLLEENEWSVSQKPAEKQLENTTETNELKKVEVSEPEMEESQINQEPLDENEHSLMEPENKEDEQESSSLEVEETVLEEPNPETEISTAEPEYTSQPATITELLARARMDSSQDLSAILGEEFATSQEKPTVATEAIIEEPAEWERKEVNERLEEPEILPEEASETVEVAYIDSEPIEEPDEKADSVSSDRKSVEEISGTTEKLVVAPDPAEVTEAEITAVTEVEVEPTVEEQEPLKPYEFPSINLLQEPVKFETSAIDDWVLEQAEALNETLEAFNVEAQVVGWTIGPAITQFELQLGRGVKVNKITNLADDLKLSLAAKDIRIEAPIPGKSTVGVEVPNKKSRPVMISEVLESAAFKESESPLTIALGVNLAGETVVTTIDKMPHGLIAGATGSGKSVFINSLLVSLLYKATPNEVKLILIDPKAVELAPYNGLPHLLSPVISEPKAANEALKWAVVEMEERYQKLAAAGVRNIEGFNKKADKNGDHALKIPYIVIIIDELADLMMVASNEVQDSIARITQKARAAGIHLIVATQRPSVDVVTGTIKNNIPTRVAFMVSSQIDSRTILDNGGAEKLLGRGDMLFQGNGSSRPVRLQGTFVEDEIDDIVDFVKDQQEANYLFQSESLLERAEELEDKDELLDEVLPFIVDQGTVSASALQRKFRIGFNRASNLIDKLESKNLISGNKGSKPRDVFLTRTDYEEKFM